jgi:hypothetical protein
MQNQTTPADYQRRVAPLDIRDRNRAHRNGDGTCGESQQLRGHGLLD